MTIYDNLPDDYDRHADPINKDPQRVRVERILAEHGVDNPQDSDFCSTCGGYAQWLCESCGLIHSATYELQCDSCEEDIDSEITCVCGF